MVFENNNKQRFTICVHSQILLNEFTKSLDHQENIMNTDVNNVNSNEKYNFKLKSKSI